MICCLVHNFRIQLTRTVIGITLFHGPPSNVSGLYTSSSVAKFIKMSCIGDDCLTNNGKSSNQINQSPSLPLPPTSWLEDTLPPPH